MTSPASTVLLEPAMMTPDQILATIERASRPVLLFYTHDTALRVRFLGRTMLPDLTDPSDLWGYRPGEQIELFGCGRKTINTSRLTTSSRSSRPPTPAKTPFGAG